MARFKASKPPDPIKISVWKGVNEAVGLTGLELGETLRQVNFRIIKDYKLEKREGHNTFINFGNELNVQGMWKGSLGGEDTLIVCNGGHVYQDKLISGTVYDSLDTSTYTNVDIVKTTALTGAEAGGTGIDNVVILYDSSKTKLTEVALTNVDLESSIGKFYFDADEKINYIVDKGTYSNIAAARTGLGATTAYYRIGVITDAKTSILYFESKLLFFNGTDYKEYDGTAFQDVPPYVPTGWVALNPTLADFTNANIFEQRNNLTGRIKAEYQGNGTTTAYQLPEFPIDADLVTMTVNGATLVETVEFTVNRTTGVITFSTAPVAQSLVIPAWTKVTVGNADLVKKNKYCMTFGPGNDTSIFLWGGPQINRRCWCAALNYKYWPVNNETYIGTNEYAITDIKAQNAKYMIVFKENRTHYSIPEQFTLPTGITAYDYPVYDLNESVGNNTFGAVQLISNNAISMDNNSWWTWSVKAVESQRSADIFSERLEQSLSLADLSLAVTFDCKSKKEYWCNIDSIVYIWNYGNNTMYTFDNISGTCFLDIDGITYYGSQGTVERMQGLNDNGIEVVPQADTGFYPFGGINLIKSSDVVYVGLLPDSKTSLTIYFKTNKITEWKKIRKVAKYSLLDFDNIDFDDFTFLTNRNPQTFPLEFSSNDYVYIQFRLENAELSETCTVLDFLVQAEVQGEV